MQIIAAPDSFKETIDAVAVAEAIARGVERVSPSIDVDRVPIADGGEGTAATLAAATEGDLRTTRVTGPLGDPVDAAWAILGDRRTAVVEMAQASGIALVPPHRRDPTRTTTYGVGQLIRAAVDAGCESVIVGIGGSATTDGGAGAAQAFGVRFEDRQGRPIESPITGGMLQHIARWRFITPPQRLPRIRVACDVTNPLCGPEGAAAVYGPQKGATPEQVEQLDRALARLASLTDFDPDTPGAGAAGGLGFGLAAFLGATLERGIDLVLEAVGFRDRCRDARLVITGEGTLDRQSTSGKAVLGVAKAAGSLGVPTIAIVGTAVDGADECVGSPHEGLLQSFVSLTGRYGADRAMNEPAACIEETAAEIIRDLQ